jgi:hypothetical protein
MNLYSRAATCLLLLTSLAVSPALAQTQSSPPNAPRSSPCPVKPEHRQFDFWVGEWEVTDKGRNSCIVLENYNQLDGYTGKSLNFFDAALGKWRQTWVDSMGNVSEFVGEYKDNAMRFEGETHRSVGDKMLRRMTLFNLGADRVRQYSERSVDGGKTWSVGYDYVYIRKK